MEGGIPLALTNNPPPVDQLDQYPALGFYQRNEISVFGLKIRIWYLVKERTVFFPTA